MRPDSGHLSRTLTAVEYFTFGFGSMVGVGWVVLIDDWLARGGPGRRAMKIVPGIPGSFTRAEWIAFALWSTLGLCFWLGRTSKRTV